MRNLIAISCLTVYLFGNTEFGQLMNMRKLISHYHQHLCSHSTISFIQFLTMHYCTDDGTKKDDQEDSQLPFKQLHQPLSSITFEVPPTASFISNIYFSKPDLLIPVTNSHPRSGFFALPVIPPEMQQ